MGFRVTVLGCGSSMGCPRPDGSWGACNPHNPKNRRTRSSILLTTDAGKNILIDSSPDLRQQTLANHVTHLDAVIWTHDHADQSHGIDDLRSFSYGHGGPLPAWGDDFTLASLVAKFRYCFFESNGYPPILRQNTINGPFHVENLEIIPFRQSHGRIHSLGFRVGSFAYSNDVGDLDETAFRAVAGVQIWMVDCLRYTPHPSHAHLDKALEWIARVAPARAILTNLHVDLDYDDLQAKLPPGVEPAYDGMAFEVS